MNAGVTLEQLAARIEALERAHDLPRRLPILRCESCGHEVAWVGTNAGDDGVCPRCDCRALRPDRRECWPPSESDADG